MAIALMKKTKLLVIVDDLDFKIKDVAHEARC